MGQDNRNNKETIEDEVKELLEEVPTEITTEDEQEEMIPDRSTRG